MLKENNTDSIPALETVGKMTLDEKIALCSGEDFWNTKEFADYGIASVRMSDGPHGLRCQPEEADMLGINESLPSTCFPTAVTASSTWDEELIEREGAAIADEARAAGVSMLLGPACNIKRNPLGGRSFEYYSEDPYLSGKLAAAYIRGVERRGVIATVKHFAVNNQEYKRQNGDSILDERTMREIYLTPFEIAVKEGRPGAVMCSYNKINGIHASDNKMLLTDILRDEWGFSGTVVTDWGGLNDRIEAFRAGCDLNMPGGSGYMETDAYNAVVRGELDEECVDRSARRIVELSRKCERSEPCHFDPESNHRLAEEIAEKGAVLLKNEGLLPLAVGEFVMIGNMVSDMRYQGSGSSHINPTKIVNIAEAAKNTDILEVGNRLGEVDIAELDVARAAAASHKAAVVVIGLPDSYESEGFDREHMRLPEGYLRLVEAVSEANPNTAVVLLSGSALELPFRDKVRAILYMGLSGQAGGSAVMKLLVGEISPSGKLTESWPLSYSDVVCADTFGKKNTEYREGVFVGYRYYETAGVTVAYPFGHGLSYSKFEYGNLSLGEGEVSFTLKNVGGFAADEIAELYISPISDKLCRPKRTLCGFKRVSLSPGEEKRITIPLDGYAVRYWDGGWKIPSGKYLFELGSSSADIRLSIETEIFKDEITISSGLSASWYSAPKGRPTREDFETLLGGEVKLSEEPKKGSFTMDSTCLEMKDSSLIMKIQYKITESVIAKKNGGKKDLSNPAYKMMLTNAVDGPMRTVVISSDGMMSESMARAFLDMANGHYLKGIGKLLFPKKKLKDNRKSANK